MKTKLAFLLLFVFLFIACPQPVINPPEPPTPPIEYIWHYVCLDSGDWQNIYCPEDRIVHKKFVKGTEPLTWCSFHKKPDPPFVYPEVIEDIHAGFLGIFLWYSYTQDLEELKKTLHEIRIRQIGTIDFFLWLSDGAPEHAHLNNRGPYLSLGGGQFDLSKWNPEFFTLFESFVIACKEHDIRPAPNLFMYGYGFGPFENNINGVRRFFTPKAVIFQNAFAERVCQILDKYFDDYGIKPLNEGRHKNRDTFHQLGLWHRAIWDDVLSRYIDISQLTVDVSLSEGTQIYLSEMLLCGKPYVEGEKHGHPGYNRRDPTNSILAETHAVNTVEDVAPPSEKLTYMKNNPRWKRYKLHGDGGNTGSFRLANTNFYQGNAIEVYDLGIYVWTKALSVGVRAIISIFPKETFRDDNGNWNLWFENYKVTNIFWGRIDALVLAWKSVYR